MADKETVSGVRRIEIEQKEQPFEIAEELKVLRTNLLFAGDDKRVLFITSCISSEGKSTISLALARSLTELDKNVLLIDADLRKDSLDVHLTQGSIDFGLSHYLSGQVALDDIIYMTESPKLAYIGSGVVPPNPSELLSSKRFDQLMKVASEVFDYVIIDCSPLGLVVDAAVIAPRCNGAILVIDSGRVKYRMAQAVVQKLQASQTPILGVVLNKVDLKKNRRYGYGYGGKYGYGYGYGYYGDKETDRHSKLHNHGKAK